LIPLFSNFLTFDTPFSKTDQAANGVSKVKKFENRGIKIAFKQQNKQNNKENVRMDDKWRMNENV